MHRKPFLFASALVSVVALCAVLAWMIEDRAAVLREGREIVLKTEPIDPRDLLRGRYVRLNYSISQIPPQLFPGGALDRVERGTAVFVRLEEAGDGFWHAAEAVIGAIPEARDADEVWIRGETQYDVFPAEIPVGASYGIERFYTPEPMAPRIEERMRDGVIAQVVVAVAVDGRAQIKALRQGGETIFTERLY